MLWEKNQFVQVITNQNDLGYKKGCEFKHIEMLIDICRVTKKKLNILC